MTVTSTTNFKEYQADGIATVFAIDFLLFDKEDLDVYINGQLITSGYKLNGLGNPISEIVFDTAPIGRLLLQRNIELIRETDYQENGDLLAKTVNKDFDRIYLAMQDTSQSLSQTVRVPDADGINSLPSKDYRANKLLGFDSNGQPVLTTIESGSALELAQALADGSDSSKGAALVNYNFSLNYPANTTGYAIKANTNNITSLTTSYTQLAVRVTTLEQQPVPEFIIIYPNNGTAEAPANVAINNRYVMDNPFPNEQVICQAEILVNSNWGNPEWVWTDNSYGVRANLFNNQIVVQTGRAGLSNASNNCGSPFNALAAITVASPCRVKVWRIT